MPFHGKERVRPVNECRVAERGIKDTHLPVPCHWRYHALLKSQIELAALEHHPHRFVMFLRGGVLDDVLSELALRGALLHGPAVVRIMVVVALHGQKDTPCSRPFGQVERELVHRDEYLRRGFLGQCHLVAVKRLDRDVLCNVEYQDDGSSATMWKQYVKNPKGFAFWRKI